ncbi:MAG: TetR/AcrR family transcriptional regulator [Acidimicrobiales bacterium]
MTTTRDRILDGALAVMRERGLARTTTKEIARASGLSEAALYKFFADKEDIFLCVLKERLPKVAVIEDDFGDVVGQGSLGESLQVMIEQIERFYEESLPIAMSLFSDSALLAQHRQSLRQKGAGPEAVLERVTAYLRAEQTTGRIKPDAPVAGAAAALVGASMHQAFLRCYHGTKGKKLIRAATPSEIAQALVASLTDS